MCYVTLIFINDILGYMSTSVINAVFCWKDTVSLLVFLYESSEWDAALQNTVDLLHELGYMFFKLKSKTN